MITIKQYANEVNSSVQAVYQALKRYPDELKGHTFKKGRTTYLDEDAVTFLKSKRAENPLVYQGQSKDDEIEELRRQLEEAQTTIQLAQSAVMKKQEEYIALQAENARLLALPAETQNKLTEVEKTLAVKETELKFQNEALDRLKNECDSSQEEIKRLRSKLEYADKERNRLATINDELRNRSFWKRLFNK